jgi:prepilin-type N-terminal cleavage/methylation domain-containing protein/prepilin-type processing-associated H-X9-DG protein
MRPRGFTLIELLVVIAIIAILAAILFPVLSRAEEAAKRASCQSNMKQMGNAFRSYADDWTGELPSAAGAVPASDNRWQIMLVRYMGSKNVSGNDRPDYRMGILRCRSSWNPTAFYQKYRYGGSYGTNMYLFRREPARTYLSLKQVKSATKTGLVIDCFVYMFYDANCVVSKGKWDVSVDVFHNGQTNVLYCDGHIALFDGRHRYGDDRDLWGDTYYMWTRQ